MKTDISLIEGKRIGTKTNRDYLSGISSLERAIENGAVLEGIALVCHEDMSLTVSLGGINGIIPKDEIAYSPIESEIKDIAVITRVGKAVCFKVMGINDDENGNKYALLSRKEAQRDCYNNYISELCSGDIIPCRITHMEHFGAFCDIGCGIISLMPIDAVSVSRISHPCDRFTPGQNINCVVKSIDYETGRVYLTHRELLGTWEENACKFSKGQTVKGIVRSIEDYGVFVELSPNLAGLAEYTDRVRVGECVSVFIKSIIPEKMKIKLVIINTYTDTDTLTEMEYYMPKSECIHRWVYSPSGCEKIIETVFE